MCFMANMFKAMSCVLFWFCKSFTAGVQLTTPFIQVYKSQLVELNCSSVVVPVDKTAEFLLGGTTLTNIRLHNNKCYNTFSGQACKPQQCGCSSDGLSYTATYRTTEQGSKIFLCKMVLHNNQIFISNEVTVSVLESPTLWMRDHIFCNQSETATFICTLQDSTVDFEFQPWQHTLHGTFIRYLKGTNDGRISVLPLRSCDIQDAGEYHCTVSIFLTTEAHYTTTTAKLLIADPPKILNMTTTHEDKQVVLEVIFYSSSLVHSVEWFKDGMHLPYHESIHTATEEHNVQMNVYDITISINGYISQLIFDDMFYTNGVYKVCINNTYGVSCGEFGHIQKGNYSTFSVFWIVIAVVLSTFTVGFLVMLMAMFYRKQFKTAMSSDETRSPAIMEANELRTIYSNGPTNQVQHSLETPSDMDNVQNEAFNPYLEILPDEETSSKRSDDYETIF